MKIVQSFWSGNQSDFSNNYGWYSYKYNWMSWILSCHQLIKYHKDVELYTDKFGYEILIKKLELPYTKVHIVLDELNHYNKNLWAVAKIKTFQMQEEPFLHVDGDVFVWESLTDKFENCNLIAQNLEITTDYYRDSWKEIIKQLSYLPEEMRDYHENKSNFACNMGIIGGTNIEFMKKYTQKSFEFVDKNKNMISNHNAFNFNIFFEQVLFKELSKKMNQNINFLFIEISSDNDYKGFGDFDKVPVKSYLHLLGIYKRNPTVCKSMEVYLMKYYPEEYSKLSLLINKKSNDNIEIENLNSQKINNLLIEFNGEIKKSFFNPNNFLLKRDIYNEGLPNVFDDFLQQKQNFQIVKLKGFEKTILNNEGQVLNCLIIEEININPTIYDLDEIDEVILTEISESIKYFDLIEKVKSYIDDEEDNSITEFIFLTNQRLRNYIILKIISIYN